MFQGICPAALFAVLSGNRYFFSCRTRLSSENVPSGITSRVMENDLKLEQLGNSCSGMRLILDVGRKVTLLVGQ